MPTLNRYSDAERDGLYVLANFGGQHPVTLQVTLIASRIFKLVGFEDADAIPKKLVDAMYELDMLYTLSSFDSDETPEVVNPSPVLEDLDILSELTNEEREMLVRYLERYSGPKEAHVEELREKLLKNSSASPEQIEVGSGIEFNRPPATSIEVKSVFLNWTPSELRSRAKNAFYLSEPFICQSIRTFATHDRLVGTPIHSIGKKEIQYEIDPVRNAESVFIADARGKSTTVATDYSRAGFDYRIRRVYRDGTEEIAHVSNGTIVNYESIGDAGSRLILSYDVDKIVPPREPTPISTESVNASARLLTDEYLSTTLDELRNRSIEHESESEGDTEPKSKCGKINSSESWRVLEVDEISNNGNAKINLDDTMIVVTDVQAVSKRENIVVRWEEGEHTVIDNADYLSNVPNKNPITWLKHNV